MSQGAILGPVHCTGRALSALPVKKPAPTKVSATRSWLQHHSQLLRVWPQHVGVSHPRIQEHPERRVGFCAGTVAGPYANFGTAMSTCLQRSECVANFPQSE